MAKHNDLLQILNSNCFYFRISIRIFPFLFWLGLTNPSMAWEKVSSRFPLISSFIHMTKKDSLEAHLLEPEVKVSYQNTISSPNNPAFQLNHNKGLRLHKRAADDDDDWGTDHSFNSNNNNAGFSGVQGAIGLNEMEITLIVVCSAIGLLMFIIGLIFLARYYWKKFHGDSHGYHGVMQRNSSESSMGTTRADPKEAMARFEEPEAANPYLLHPSDALLIKQQIIEQSAEKEPLLPCANGTAFTDRQQINTDKSEAKNETKIDNMPLTVTPSKKQLPTKYVAQLQNTLNSRTGLSQSDCSISSFTTTNPSYKYGNQTGYMSGYYGYPYDTTFDNDNFETSTKVIKGKETTMPVVSFRPGNQDEEKSTKTQLSNEKDIKNVDDQVANEVNECDYIVDDDILSADPYRLTGTTRALSLPESFDREENIKDESKDVDSVRPTDSGWGDTVKGQFRGSLPVLHLSVSPEKEKSSVNDSASSYPNEKEKITDKSLPISLSKMLPKRFDKS